MVSRWLLTIASPERVEWKLAWNSFFRRTCSPLILSMTAAINSLTSSEATGNLSIRSFSQLLLPSFCRSSAACKTSAKNDARPHHGSKDED